MLFQASVLDLKRGQGWYTTNDPKPQLLDWDGTWVVSSWGTSLWSIPWASWWTFWWPRYFFAMRLTCSQRSTWFILSLLLILESQWNQIRLESQWNQIRLESQGDMTVNFSYKMLFEGSLSTNRQWTPSPIPGSTCFIPETNFSSRGASWEDLPKPSAAPDSSFSSLAPNFGIKW